MAWRQRMKQVKARNAARCEAERRERIRSEADKLAGELLGGERPQGEPSEPQQGE